MAVWARNSLYCGLELALSSNKWIVVPTVRYGLCYDISTYLILKLSQSFYHENAGS